MNRKLGKLPARNAIKLRLASFTNPVELPKPPANMGHEGLIGRHGWLMLGNDRYSNCVWAGAAHEHMMHARIVSNPVMFNTDNVNSDYSASTGFNVNRPETDNGDDMQYAASYRRRIGVIDTHGNRHKVAAYVALDPGNVEQLFQALYLFGAVGIGLELPQSAMDQVDRGVRWDVVPGSHMLGGHYVSLVGRHYGELRVVTWGAIQPMTDAFLKKYCDEAVAYIFPESLVDRKSPEGFDYDQLVAALKELSR